MRRCSIAARAATSPSAAAQRRLREAYFVAIVTPAIKQLKKMLADMAQLRRASDVRPTPRSASRDQNARISCRTVNASTGATHE